MSKLINEKGIATIMTIGFVVLMFCIALAFITTSIIEKKSSLNFQSIAVARLAAQSAMSRALAQMKSIDTRLPLHDKVYSYRYENDSADSESDRAGETLKLINALSIQINGTDYVPVSYSGTDTPFAWIYNVDTDRKLISRMAYVVITDSGKLDPSAVLDSGTTSGLHPSEINTGIAANATNGISGENNREITMTTSTTSKIIGRPGANVNEIFLRSITNSESWFTSTGIGNYAERMSMTNSDGTSSTGATSTYLLPGNRWADYDQIFKAIEIDQNDITNFKNLFSVYEPAIPEEYWIDVNSDGIRSMSELYSRFNLGNANWDSLTISDIDIPWLQNWKNQGGFPSASDAKNQIIANLIDYCDSDDNPTTDYSGSNIPTYFGLEKVPYVNEVRIPLSINLEKNGSGNKTWRYHTISIMDPGVEIELVNMYGSVPDSKVKLTLYISMRVNGTESLPSFIYENDLFPTPYSFLSSGYQKQASTFYSLDGTTAEKYNVSSLPLEAKVDTLIVEVSSSTTTQYYDYAAISTPSTAEWISLGNIPDGVWQERYIDFQVKDPRQNLLPSDWEVDIDSSSNGTLDELNPKNSNFPSSFSGTDTDIESNNIQPYEISTAYIRNAPMKSPWELGFIHRGKAFQTINLKQYNTTEGYNDGAGGNSYSDGDANILDQIKMSSEDSEYGKVNLNTQNDTVLRSLFDKIRIGSDPDNPGWLTTYSITNNNGSDTAAQISSTIRGFTSGTNLSTRAELLSNSSVTNKLTTLSGQVNDRTQEEVIGKFINLTDASPGNVFYVIAIGEAIKDVGFGNSTNFEVFDSNADMILATQKIYAIIQRNPIDNSFKIIRLQYVTE
ncbi:MAG TPA: hypothetical protein DD381_02270 [Lentisphaeria bacterium]|nr:MAG: hypothetical protein A2X47_08765 [Lentisphaerae bacterium GWF2_38_69]HBM15162.1 hypothetical protein [Lentisphaeria bacterium]